MVKKVFFSEINKIYTTYSPDEYLRNQIDSILYKKNYNRVSNDEWNTIFLNLDLYKLYEMPVHSDSIQNNSYNTKKVIYTQDLTYLGELSKR
jgi:hypothetical protein